MARVWFFIWLRISGNAAQEVHEVADLRVLHMEGCGYLIHPSYLLEYMDRSLNSPSQLFFVVLDDDSPRVSSFVCDLLVNYVVVWHEWLSSNINDRAFRWKFRGFFKVWSFTESMSSGTRGHCEEPVWNSATNLFFTGSRCEVMFTYWYSRIQWRECNYQCNRSRELHKWFWNFVANIERVCDTVWESFLPITSVCSSM